MSRSYHKHHLGKSGNRIGRHEVWIWSIQMLSPVSPANPFRTYYQRLRGRGMSGSVAIGHLAEADLGPLVQSPAAGSPTTLSRTPATRASATPALS